MASNLRLTQFNKHHEDPSWLAQAGAVLGRQWVRLLGTSWPVQLAQHSVVGVTADEAMDRRLWISSEVLPTGGDAQDIEKGVAVCQEERGLSGRWHWGQGYGGLRIQGELGNLGSL